MLQKNTLKFCNQNHFSMAYLVLHFESLVQGHQGEPVNLYKENHRTAASH
jgi:hypothetical protein